MKWIKWTFTLCFIQIIFSGTVFAQVCKLKPEKISAYELSSNSVQEVVIYSGDRLDTNCRIASYMIAENGCAVRVTEYDNYAKDYGPLITEYFGEGSQRVMTFVKGRFSRSGFNTIERQEDYYSITNQLIKTIKETHIDFDVMQISIYDPAFPDRVDFNELKMLNGDTLHWIVRKENDRRQEYTLLNKRQGIWKETEKSITVLDQKGELLEYSLYKDGVLVSHKEKKDITGKKFERPEEVFENPLPASNYQKRDTSYTDDLLLLTKSKNSKPRFRVVTVYQTGDSKKIEAIYVYEVFRGILRRYISPYSNSMSEFYDYKYK